MVAGIYIVIITGDYTAHVRCIEWCWCELSHDWVMFIVSSAHYAHTWTM